jgi:cell volume regulation protein A
VFAGLKGAVPLLLGSFLLEAHVAHADRLYAIVVVVVVLSVVVQGSLVPTVGRVMHVPMRTVEPEPWSLGVRLRDEPNGVHRLTVSKRSAADRQTIGEFSALPEGAWVSFVVRAGQLVPVSADTTLLDGDEVLVLAAPELADQLRALFELATPGQSA